ncbi:MAG: division plane positioning ATPase MipZ [Rhodomicrobium sp.]
MARLFLAPTGDSPETSADAGCLDPQESLTRLCELRDRREGISHDNPVLLTGVRNVKEAIDKLERTGFARDVLFIDTPGSMVPIIQSAVNVADCILLPIRPSVLDLVAQEDAALIASEYGKQDAIAVVLNAIDGRAGAEDSEKRIISRFGKKPVRVNQRVAYSRALVAGKSGAEIDKECSREIRELWAAIEEVLRRERHVEVRRKPTGHTEQRQ